MLQKDEVGAVEAMRCFEESIRISELVQVPRLKVEAYWGLTQAYGFRGDLKTAQQMAADGLAIAQAAGDEWVCACIRLTLGASFVVAGELETAVSWINQATSAFRDCGDTYGETVGYLWQCLVWYKLADQTRLSRDLGDFLQRVKTHSYEFLFTHKTLMGPPDPRALVPLLLAAREDDMQTAVATQLLSHMGLAQIKYHPGYQLSRLLTWPFSFMARR
ncbi:MAG: hypothetical protein M5U34_19425 [Chloroflexi bacterium]|nr:hypothetical protein [Chloroflexota bacterium]